MDSRIWALAETLWRYHRLNHELSHADAILVFCSHDLSVADRGAQLWLEGWAPLLVFSGGLGAITRRLWTEPEADRFARIAVGLGVPRQAILIENRSTNTGENVRFTRRLLEERRAAARRFIVVQKPYMERRAYATFRKAWPEAEVIVTSPQVPFDRYLREYSNEALSPEDVVGIMVGDLQRIRLYPEKGFQVPQEIPGDVRPAYEALVQAGFTKYLVGEEAGPRGARPPLPA